MEASTTALIVDDDRSIQRLLHDALAAEGFSVLVEKDGDWALKSFEKRKVDVVILDLMLPGQHGFEVARRIRIQPKGRNVPILFVSGVYKSAQHLQEARSRYEVSAFLDKPINLGKLRAALREALGNRYPQKASAQAHKAHLDARPAEDYAAPEEHEEVAQVEHTARTSALKTIRGDFAHKPIPELLAELYRWRASGALLLRRDKVKKIVYFRDGHPYSIKSNLLSECLGKVMVREKMISEQECERSIKEMKSSGRQQGTVLIEMGCISPHNLSYALSLQLQTKLYDIFEWSEGEYQFNPDAEMPADVNTLGLTTAQVIYEGVKRTYSEDRVRAALGPCEQLFAHPSADPLLRFQEVGLDEEESSVLKAVDGHKTVSTLVALNLLPPLGTLHLLYAMRAAQIIDLKREAREGKAEPLFPWSPAEDESRETTDLVTIPAGMPGSAQPLPPPLPPQARAVAPGASSAQLAPPPPPPQAFAPDKPASTSLLPELSGVFSISMSGEERRVRERLAGVMAAMKKKDFFEVLGVAPTAGKDEIKRAYFGLAKEYHPDKHFGSYSAEVKNLAAQIFDLVSSAHDTLVDDDERERYLSELASGARKGVTDEVAKILAAEGKFEKGEELLRNRKFKDAHSAFQEAVQLYGEEGEFHAYLGWSLFQAEPSSPQAAEKAVQHIESGIRLNPRVDKSYLFLGYIHKALGRPDRAEKQFEKAIQVNPDCIEALRELRLLGNKSRPPPIKK